MRKRKTVNLLIILAMVLSYLAPVQQALASEPSLQVRLMEPVVDGQHANLGFDVLLESSAGEIESIELVKNGSLINLDIEPVKVEESETVRTLRYTYADSIEGGEPNVTYSVRVHTELETVESASVVATADLGTMQPSEGVPVKGTTTESNEEAVSVVIPDPNLENAIREQIYIDGDRDLTSADLENVYYLDLGDKGITNLSGLEYAVNVQYLNLANNPIDSIQPVLQLANLVTLDLANTSINTLQGIEGLIALDDLNIANTRVDDLSPLLGAGKPLYVNAYGIPVDFATDEEVIRLLGQLELKGFTIYYDQSTDATVVGYGYTASESSALIRWGYNGEWDENLAFKLYVDGEPQDGLAKGVYEYTIKELQPNTQYIVKIEALKGGVSTGETGIMSIVTDKIPSGESIYLEDQNLANAVRKTLSVYNRDFLESDFEKLTSIEAPASAISSLAGLENASKLGYLEFRNNNISDLEPLRHAENLYSLYLAHNPIQDISVLSTITNLSSLDLSFTKVQDISPLLDLPNLNYVNIEGIDVDFDTDAQAQQVIADLKAKGVSVYYETLGYISLDWRTTDSKISLSWTFSEGKTPDAYKIYLDGNEIAETTDTTFTIEGLEPATEYLVEVAAVRNGELTGETNNFYLTTQDEVTGNVIEIKDTNLEQLIRDQLWIYDRELRDADLARLTYLFAGNEHLTSLSGLEYAVNLESLLISNNNISDLTPIAGLTSLRELDLSYNPVADFTALNGFVNLEMLFLNDTELSDLSFLQKMPKLYRVGVRNIGINYSQNTEALAIIKELLANGVEVSFVDGYLNAFTNIVTENSIELKWEVYMYGDDGFEPDSYKVFLNGVEQIETSGNEYTLTGLEPNTSYFVEVHALKDGMIVLQSDYMSLSTARTPEGEVIQFADSNLESVVRDELGVYDRDIRESDMERLYSLSGEGQGIESLLGLESAINLQYLYLGSNSITDITPLIGLEYLYSLDLSYNPIEDISALGTMKSIDNLNLSGTGVSNLSPILELPNLYWLGIKDVAIDYDYDDVAMAIITELKDRGVDVSYKDLGWINFNQTKATHDSIYIEWEYYGSTDWGWEELEPPAAYKIFVNGQEIAEVTDTSYVIENLDPDTEYVVDIKGFTNDRFTEEESTEYIRTVLPPSGEVVTIVDTGLEEMIREELWVYGRPLQESDMLRLTNLSIYHNEISSLAGLENAVNIEELSLYGNKISDISPISSLENLRYLELSQNRISDIAPLEGLDKLEYLTLDYNQVSDISVLANLKSLRHLSIYNNRVSDISALNGLVQLRYLDLDGNLIKNISPLSTLTNLNNLYLSLNPVSDIEPLRNLVNLDYVNLYGMPLDFSEGSPDVEVIQYLRDQGISVYTNEGYFEEIWLDTFDVTDTSAKVNWSGNIDPEQVATAQITVYSHEQPAGSVGDDVYGGVYGDVYDDVYDEVYRDVYSDVYQDGTVEAVYEVNYTDFNYVIEGLQPSTTYSFKFEVTLKDGKTTDSKTFIRTNWSKENLVENVSFKVVDQEGNTVPNAEVSIEGAEGNTEDVFLYGYTNANGQFQSWYNQGTSLALPEGIYYFHIIGNGKYESDYQEVMVARNGDYPIEIVAKKAEINKTPVTFKVKDIDGNPVTDLTYVSLYSSKTTERFGYSFGAFNQWDMSSEDGTYVMDDITIANDYVINIEAEDYKVWSKSNVAVKDNAQIEITLEKGAEIQANVKTKDGQPVTGANYSIYGATSSAYGTVETAGSLHEVGLNIEDVTIEVSMPGYLTYNATVTADQFVDGLAVIGDIILEPEQFIEGYVYKAKADEPVQYANVTLYGEGDKFGSYWSRTDANGYFKIRNVKPGSYKVTADAYNLPTAEIASVNAGESVEIFLVENKAGAFTGEGNSFTSSKNTAVPGETIEYRLNYFNHSAESASNVDFSFTLPEGVEAVADSLVVSGRNADGTKFTTNKTVTLSNVAPSEKGTVSFKAKVKDTAQENIVSSASIVANGETVNFNSSVSLTFVTLNGPEATSESKVKLYGNAKPGSTIKVYDGNKLLVETVVPVNSRWWYADVQLPVQDGVTSTHQLVAKVTTKDTTAQSTPIKIKYNPSVPKLTDISITAGWNKDVTLNPYTGVATMAIVEFTPIKIKAQFDQSIEKASLHFLGGTYPFINKGDYYEATIPGTWSSYGEQLMELTFEKNGQKISMPILEVIVLIDPSGYVFEGSMDNRLPGVVAVVDEQMVNGSWKPWNAANFGQVNPQVTDEDGRYGWDVIQGAWRVQFSKEGYQKYISRTVYVPPAETQLNVPLVRESLPVVSETSLDSGTEYLPVDTTIEVTFDRLMDESTVENSIVILDQNQNEVAGSLTGKEHYFGYKEVEGKPGYFEEDQSKLVSQTFTWSGDSELAGGTYQLIVSTEATDYAGKKLEEDKVVSFTIEGADTTAPAKPVVKEVTDKSTSVTGTAEAEATVEVKVAGKVLGSAKADGDGNFTISITVQKAGTELTVTAADAKGNVSEATKVVVKETETETETVANGWELVNKQWFFYKNGTKAVSWEKVSGKWYYFDGNGVMQTGWEKISGKWYYFNGTNGDMLTGWAKISGKWYYFDALNGDMKTSWQKVSGKWYYFNVTNGDMKTGWQKVSGDWYYLDPINGDMKSGWLKISGKWYYLANSGIMKTGWIVSGSKWYYLYNDGSMAANTVIGGYRLGSDGAWIK